MIEHHLLIPTLDGSVDTFACWPERGGPVPVVIFFMDAPGIREELRDMARRIASTGYGVLLPNLFYRAGHGAGPGEHANDPDHADHQRMWELLRSLDTEGVMRDTAGLLAWVDQQPALIPDQVACIGYCMSGPFAINAASRFPDRVRCAASLYGVGLVTDQPNSPHHGVANITGEVYISTGSLDRYSTPAHAHEIGEHMAAAGVRHEIEIQQGVDHGFGFAGRNTYDKPAAERLWERLFALFARNLSRRAD